MQIDVRYQHDMNHHSCFGMSVRATIEGKQTAPLMSTMRPSDINVLEIWAISFEFKLRLNLSWKKTARAGNFFYGRVNGHVSGQMSGQVSGQEATLIEECST